MRKKILTWSFGAALVGISAFALLYPRAPRSPFENGFGLRLVGERSNRPGTVSRYYASTQRFEPFVRSIDRQFPASGSTMEGMRMWANEEGLVTASRTSLDAPEGGWPEGTATYVTTFAPKPPSLLQKAARLVGIKL